MTTNTPIKTVGEGLVGAAGMVTAVFTPMLRPWRTSWGATPEEVECTLPGDEYIERPKWEATHAITIAETAENIWPWLVQIGQGRGGFYSYEFLENLVGCDIHNADRILPEFQHLKVGDVIHLHPQSPPIPIVAIEPNRYILLHACNSVSTHEDSNEPDEYINVSWLFYLKPIDARSCRLISRWRSDYKQTLANKLGYGPTFIEPISFVMDRKMLLGIKERVEGLL